MFLKDCPAITTLWTESDVRKQKVMYMCHSQLGVAITYAARFERLPRGNIKIE